MRFVLYSYIFIRIYCIDMFDFFHHLVWHHTEILPQSLHPFILYGPRLFPSVGLLSSGFHSSTALERSTFSRYMSQPLCPMAFSVADNCRPLFFLSIFYRTPGTGPHIVLHIPRSRRFSASCCRSSFPHARRPKFLISCCCFFLIFLILWISIVQRQRLLVCIRETQSRYTATITLLF